MFVIQQHTVAKTDYLLSRMAVVVDSGKGSEYGVRPYHVASEIFVVLDWLAQVYWSDETCLLRKICLKHFYITRQFLIDYFLSDNWQGFCRFVTR